MSLFPPLNSWGDIKPTDYLCGFIMGRLKLPYP